MRQTGRVALLAETEFGAFQALRLRAKHGVEVQLERTRPFNEFEGVREGVREAAQAYETRDEPATPYAAFASGRELPSKTEMQDREL